MPAKSAVTVGVALTVLGLIALGVYGVDQLSKAIALAGLPEGSPLPALGAVVEWRLVRNSGAAFSLASGATWIFTVLAVAVVSVIAWLARRIRSLAWATMFGLLLGGVLGNLTDRLFREPGFGVGHVIDFISTPWLLPAIYNVADIAIVSSMLLFVVLTLRGIGLDGNRRSENTSRSVTGDDV